jgi:pimeloyl-ACP methyl ester carboxylesterase
MGSFTSFDGTRVHFDDTGGEGRAVMLVHGITESSKCWGSVAERLDDHRVVTIDLRGHGQSGMADRYDLEAMATDILMLAAHLGLERPHLVGHSLGGAVVSAAGAAADVASVINIDQSLDLAGFQAGLLENEAMLRDPATFPLVISALFEEMAGPMLQGDARVLVDTTRRADQDVVLGVWELMFSMSADEIAAVVDGALAGYAGNDTPYLSLFGIDPGAGYGAWLGRSISTAVVEIWDEHGHYPHLVDPDRFVDRCREHWASQ